MRNQGVYFTLIILVVGSFLLGYRVELFSPLRAQQNQESAEEKKVSDLPPPDMGLPPGMEPPIVESSANPPLPPEVVEGMGQENQMPGNNPSSSQPTELMPQIDLTGGYVYDPTGRRDPFVPPQSMIQPEKKEVSPLDQGPAIDESTLGSDPLLSYYLKDYRVLAIIWDISEPKAMISAPNSRVYTIRKKMKLGREGAVVVAIREREIVLVEPDENGNFEKGIAKILRLRN